VAADEDQEAVLAEQPDAAVVDALKHSGRKRRSGRLRGPDAVLPGGRAFPVRHGDQENVGQHQEQRGRHGERRQC
jgi:hypothetical protein